MRIIGTVLLLAIGLIVVLLLVPSEQVARIASAQVEQAIGRKLTISGKVSPSFWPQIGARVENIAVANADWSDAGSMLEAEALSVGLDLSALIGGDIKIRQVKVVAPVIRLERAADGRVNWNFSNGVDGGSSTETGSGTQDPAGSDGGIGAITLDRGSIEEGKLTFIDHETGQSQTLDALNMTLALPTVGGQVAVDFTANMNATPISGTGRIETLAMFAAGEVVPMSLGAAIGKSTVEFAGTVGVLPPVANGTLKADLSDLAAIAGIAGVTAPDLPEGLGHDRVAFEGRVSWTAERSFHLRGGEIVLDGNRLAGDLDLTTAGERPKLTGTLTGESLAFMPKTDASGSVQGTASGPDVSGWSTSPIDVSALSAMDADIGLEATSLSIGDTTVGPLQVTLTNDRARAVVDIARMAAYRGAVSGQFVVNGRGGLSVGGDLSASGVAVQPLLKDAAGYERLTGTGVMAVKFLGSGKSMADIMSGLSGQGRFAFNDGALIGLDLAGMLRSLDVNYVGEGQKTIFDAVTGSFVIDGGVLTNDDLALAGPLVSATGAGSVGIGTRTLDYRVVPSALAKDDGSGGIRVPLLIRGTWDDPEFKLDLEALAKEKLDVDEAALKAKLDADRQLAEEKAKAKAAAALGVAPVEGESLEDAAKRKLQEEALKGLGKLFGGN